MTDCYFCGKGAEIKCKDCEKSFCNTCHGKHNVIKKDHAIKVQQVFS